jgi:hypothetical protein
MVVYSLGMVEWPEDRMEWSMKEIDPDEDPWMTEPKKEPEGDPWAA